MVFLDALKSLPPLAAIFLVSLAISFLVTIVYKFTTNQKFMKLLHADMKSLRDEIKTAKDAAHATDLNKRLMEKTMQQIMHSMKSTFITIIPIFFIFGWMGNNMAFSNLEPGEEFTTTMAFGKAAAEEATIEAETLQILSNTTQQVTGNTAQWKLKASEGEHKITYFYGDETYARTAIATSRWEYADPSLEKKKALLGVINIGDKQPIKQDSQIQKITIDLKPVRPLGDFEIFGWKPGWLATYFIFTLLLTFPIRKLLKVH